MTKGVMNMFKKRRGIDLPYNKQGLIYFICINAKDMPKDIQQGILNLCIRVSKEHYQALYTFLTDETKNVSGVAMQYHISETQLYLYRKRFYERYLTECLYNSA